MSLFSHSSIRLDGGEDDAQIANPPSFLTRLARILNPAAVEWKFSGTTLFLVLQLIFYGAWFLGQFTYAITSVIPPYDSGSFIFCLIKLIFGAGYVALTILLIRLHHSPLGSQIAEPPFSHLFWLVAISGPIVWSFLALIQAMLSSIRYRGTGVKGAVMDMIEVCFFLGGMVWLIISVVAAVVGGVKWIWGGDGTAVEGYTEVAREEGDVNEEVW